MNNQQIAKKNMFNKLLVFFAASANSSIWSTFTRLVTEIANFVTLNNDLDLYIQQQNLETKGVTSDKDQKFERIVKHVVKFARKARVWAHDNHDSDLETQFDVHKDDFVNTAQDLGLEKMKNVRNALNANILALASYNVLPADITHIDTAITEYETTEGAPGAAAGKKEAGTEGIELTIGKIDKSLEIIDDLLVNEYTDGHGEMVEEYKNDRKIETVGVHHQGMDAHITYDDNSGDAEGITMKIVELKKEGTSNILGHVDTLRGKIGTYHVEFSGPGIQTKTIIASIKRSQILHLAVQVKKQ